MMFPRPIFLAAALPPATPAPATPPPVTAVVDKLPTETSHVLKVFVDWLQSWFPSVPKESYLIHWIACALIILAAVLLRRLITNICFNRLKKLAAKTKGTLYDRLFPALETPVATLVMVEGIYAALTVLPLSPAVDAWLAVGSEVAVETVCLWGIIKAGGAVLDHLAEITHEKQPGVAAFMPLIKKTLFVLAVLVGGLIIAQSMHWPVESFLAGLGIGGLAFAFAAQDTLANLFGSFVVVMDHPFRVGEFVRIGSAEGRVEDIGLRSTKIRTAARTLIIIPTKSVASEFITNYTRMGQRRVDQTIGLTYDATPEQLQGILEDIRVILRKDPGVHPQTILAHFTTFNESSLDLQLVYFTSDPEWPEHFAVRERVNLAIMRAVAARGMSFAFPTSVMHLDGPVAKQLAERKG